MKKTFGIFLAVCLLFALLPAPAMAADEIEIEGILYTIENQEAIVTGYDQDALYEFEDYWTRTFVIPEAVNGAPVTRVADGAFDRALHPAQGQASGGARAHVCRYEDDRRTQRGGGGREGRRPCREGMRSAARLGACGRRPRRKLLYRAAWDFGILQFFPNERNRHK